MSNLKTLRVCLSEDLPDISERSPDFIYFIYDKLMVFLGQSIYSDPFAIVETMPTDPIFNMLYFVLEDGKVKAYVDYSIIEIAEIESQEQLEILKQSGTTFFTNSEKRYLDLQRRIITLPFQNGTYELTVSLANNLKIDENTVIGFNPETNCFEIIGKREDFDMVFARGYRGKETNSVKTTVSEHSIRTDIKISNKHDNILRIVNDGLYANAEDKVTKKQFDSWVESFREYKLNMESYLKDLISHIEETQGVVSPTSINERIYAALEEVYPEIDHALEEYDTLAAKLDEIDVKSREYTDTKFNDAYNDLYNAIVEATTDPWETFGSSEDTNTPIDDESTNNGEDEEVIVEEESDDTTNNEESTVQDEETVVEETPTTSEESQEEEVIEEEIVSSDEETTTEGNTSEDVVVDEESQSDETVEEVIENEETSVEESVSEDENVTENNESSDSTT